MEHKGGDTLLLGTHWLCHGPSIQRSVSISREGLPGLEGNGRGPRGPGQGNGAPQHTAGTDNLVFSHTQTQARFKAFKPFF